MLGEKGQSPPTQGESSAPWIAHLGLPGLLQPAPESGQDVQTRIHWPRM